MATIFSDPPRTAAWRHRDARVGFEVVFLRLSDDDYCVEGHTVAVEDGEAWAVDYVIGLSGGWLTRSAWVEGHSATGRRELTLEANGSGGWMVDGSAAPELDGCLDVDLESSALTNALPVHRLGLEVGEGANAPAAYVRAHDLTVERLEQRYVREPDDGRRQRYHYAAPAFGFETDLLYDQAGLVIDYPGLAIRIA
jgi:uncharacterized protein